jgi:hypothetical protein
MHIYQNASFSRHIIETTTHFFDTQKNLSFSLENNNIVKTYIHPNNKEPIRLELISFSSIYNVTFSKFDEFESSNQKNNNFVSGSFNSLTDIKNSSMFSSSVFLQYRSEQYLDSTIVFSLLSFLSFKLTHFSIVDSSCSYSDFEDLILYLVYRSSPSSPLFSSSPLLTKL